MARSNWKPKYIGKDFLLQHNFEEVNKFSEIFLYNRSTRIHRKMVGLTLQVYNGIRYFSFVVNAEMVGHCVGEFSPTRKKPLQKKKKIKKK